MGPSLFLDIANAQEPAMQNGKNLKELFSETLKDIYFAEKQILRALPKMAREAASPELKQLSRPIAIRRKATLSASISCSNSLAGPRAARPARRSSAS
jgi:hypothetical protein